MQRAHLTIAAIIISTALGSAIYLGNDEQTGATSFRALPEIEAEAEILRISDAEGPEAAWRFLKRALMSDGNLMQSANDAHELAHVLGKDIYRRLGTNGIDVCDQSFTFGCYHGFVRALIEDKGSDLTGETCEKAPDKGSCIHGFGHALASISTDSLRDALQTCDTLFDEFTFACWEGIFMEFIKTYTPPQNEDLWHLCLGVPEKYRERCAHSLPGHAAGLTSGGIAALCERGSTVLLRTVCADAFGADVVHRSGGNVETTVNACASLSSRLQFSCFSSAAQLFILEKYANAEQDANRLCEHVPESLDACQNEIRNAQESLR